MTKVTRRARLARTVLALLFALGLLTATAVESSAASQHTKSTTKLTCTNLGWDNLGWDCTK